MKYLVLLLGYENVVVAERIMVRSHTLAQASLSLLCESCRNRLGSYLSSRSSRALVWARWHLAQAGGARLSENPWKP